ncbi:hypothetical protein OHA72_04915 [Dactylosporangium sp. NBC_01737]|uniref:hypothetical protein n=1 Tax=Dactylosporangium sp. NBC_01737 TaxID=2975959 RepID=UPI002E166472|nr:hypothetical protein OHA72_04915 [Dactylosporangium sp. NBC_01737]
MDPSKPNEPSIDQGRSIPRSRPGDGEVLEGEVLGKDEPLGRPGAVPPRAPEPPKRGLGLRKTLLLVVAVVAVGLCLGGGITAYVLYDKATTPDRSTPEGVLEQYLDAKFSSRDNIRAKLFECPGANLADVETALTDVKSREARFSIMITVKPASFDVQVTGKRAEAKVTLNVLVPEADGRETLSLQEWQFLLENNRSWLICSAKKLA